MLVVTQNIFFVDGMIGSNAAQLQLANATTTIIDLEVFGTLP